MDDAASAAHHAAGGVDGVGSFDHYARLVRRLLDVPVGLVSIVGADRQVFPGVVGLPEPWQTARQTPLSHSFCQYVVRDQRPLIISDARLDARLSTNRAIEELDVIAYAGWPLLDAQRRAVGSVCAIDSRPREWTREEIETLEDLALACTAEWTQREQARATALALGTAEKLSERSRLLLALSEGLSFTETLGDVASAIAQVSAQALGCVRAGMWLRDSALSLSKVPVPLPDGPQETLHFVEDSGTTWTSASVFSDLPLDSTNPIGAAAGDRATLFYSHRTAQNEKYPHLANDHQLGEARAFVPLMAGGHVYGALALVWPDGRRFSDDDAATVAAFATYSAQAVHRAQLFQERVDAAWTLQRAMLTDLPQPDHLELVARYRPAAAHEQVGGDWYDAVVMPTGATHLVIGDVEGHDVRAAAVMGQLRSMLRMASWMSESTPAADLSRLDRAMSDLGVEPTASVILARVEQTEADAATGLRRLRWSNAGHLPPLLVTPGDGAAGTPSARFLESGSAGDPILGVHPDCERHDDVVAIEPGATLLLYTDGLVERRHAVLDTGLEQLRAAAERAAALPTAALVDAVLDEMSAGVGEDDVAVLAVRFGPEGAGPVPL